MDPEEEFVLIHFEEEDTCSVVTADRICEADYKGLRHITVIWGKGNHAKRYPARLIFFGMWNITCNFVLLLYLSHNHNRLFIVLKQTFI